MADQLIPRAPKRKKQPSADQLRQNLVWAADEIIRQRELAEVRQVADAIANKPIAVYVRDERPWWRRWLGLAPAPTPASEHAWKRHMDSIVPPQRLQGGYQPIDTGEPPREPPKKP